MGYFALCLVSQIVTERHRILVHKRGKFGYEGKKKISDTYNDGKKRPLPSRTEWHQISYIHLKSNIDCSLGYHDHIDHDYRLITVSTVLMLMLTLLNTAVPFEWQTTGNLSVFSPKRDRRFLP